MDVCALMPGSMLASTLNLPLVGTESCPGICSDAMRDDSGEAVFDVVLTSSGIFLFTRNTSEDAKDVPGFGVAAFTRKVTGIYQDLWVARKDGLFFHVGAPIRMWPNRWPESLSTRSREAWVSWYCC